MSLLKSESRAVFDLSQIGRGDCIRIRRAGDTTYRNGFITEAAPEKVRLLYCNTQNNATSYLDITAADTAVGVWEIYLTRDFQTINYEYNGASEDGAV